MDLGLLIRDLAVLISPCGKVGVIRLTSSCGKTGYGQLGNKDVDITAEIFTRHVAPAILDGNVVDPFKATQKVLSFELNYKHMGVQLSKAISGLDTAMWDCLGKVHSKVFGYPFLIRHCINYRNV